MFGFFRKKDNKNEIEEIKRAVQTGFNSAKHDINNLGVWVKHLNTSGNALKNDISDIHGEIASIKDEIENIKNMLSLVGDRSVFKQKQTVFDKQTVFKSVLNTVQTPVQTALLNNLTVTERAIIFVLLNSDMKLSYEDIAAMLGKTKTTIRGQINSIKQKSGGLLEEAISSGNNKKRVYIPEKVKEILLKRGKVRVGKGSKIRENEESREKEV